MSADEANSTGKNKRNASADADHAADLFRRPPTRREIAGHFVHIDDGEYHGGGRYWSNPADVRDTAMLLADSEDYDHLLLYAHGGLNNITTSARRIAAMKETFKKNRIYPYHFMYDTGLLEEIKDVITDKNKNLTAQARGLSAWTDTMFEQITHRPGRGIWRQMKAGAQSSFKGTGAGIDVLKAFLDAQSVAGKHLKIHLVGHSMGSILHAYLANAFAEFYPGRRLASVGLLAPAATNDLFISNYRPLLKASASEPGIDRMKIYNLTDRLEREDSVVAIYRKSLLYLVSRSFEENPRPQKLLGMQKYNRGLTTDLPRLKIKYSDGTSADNADTSSETHSGFDNDAHTMNSVLGQILGSKPAHPFTVQSLRY